MTTKQNNFTDHMQKVDIQFSYEENFPVTRGIRMLAKDGFNDLKTHTIVISTSMNRVKCTAGL